MTPTCLPNMYFTISQSLDKNENEMEAGGKMILMNYRDDTMRKEQNKEFLSLKTRRTSLSTMLLMKMSLH